MDKAQLELLAEYEMGEYAQRFIDSQLGQYVVGCAVKECEGLRAQLEAVDPTDWKAVARLQNDIKCRSLSLQWIARAIDSGNTAAEQLQLENSEDQ